MRRRPHVAARVAMATPAMALLARGAPAIAQRLGQAADAGPPAWRVVLSLLFCLGLAVGPAVALRIRLTARSASLEPGRAGGWRLRNPARGFLTATPRRVRVIETLRVSHHLDICLFSCDDRWNLLAAVPGGATVLVSMLRSGRRPTRHEAPHRADPSAVKASSRPPAPRPMVEPLAP